MRNFTSVVDFTNTYVLSEKVGFTDTDFIRVQQALMIAMGANPDDMSPGEEAVLADFIGWFKSCKQAASDDCYAGNSCFCYHNLNEGHSVVVAWVANMIHDIYRLGEVDSLSIKSDITKKRAKLLRKT